jgi:hypothetical protein
MELDFSSIDQAGRERVARAWAFKMQEEYLAVSRFSRYVIELAEVGCSPRVFELCAQSAADEARHATACGNIVHALLGGIPAITPRAFTYEPWTTATREQSIAISLAETCCIGETISIAMFLRMLESVRDPSFRTVIEGLLADEVTHGRLGFLYLAELRAGGRTLDHVTAALPQIIESQIGDIFEPTEAVDDPVLEQFGYLGPDATRAVYRKVLDQMILPGFEGLGIDTAATRRLAADRGWLKPT